MISDKDILSHSKEIAIVRTDRLGDMILTLPLAMALKKRFHKARISMIARSYTKPLLYKSPALDNYFLIDEFRHGIEDIFYHNNFNAVFFPHPRFDEALAAYNSDIRLRIGSAYRLYSMLYNCRIKEHRKESLKHEAEYNVSMLGSILNENIETELAPLAIKNNALQFVKDKLKELDISSDFIIIHPGSGGSAFDWDIENFALLAELIHSNYGYHVLITGIHSELEKCSYLCKLSKNSKNLCGIFDLDQILALISLAKTLIANSTGVLHIAAALKIPVLGLYPNSPHLSQKRWGPYSKKSIVINPPKSNNKIQNDNMLLITPESVFEGFNQLITFNDNY